MQDQVSRVLSPQAVSISSTIVHLAGRGAKKARIGQNRFEFPAPDRVSYLGVRGQVKVAAPKELQIPTGEGKVLRLAEQIEAKVLH